MVQNKASVHLNSKSKSKVSSKSKSSKSELKIASKFSNESKEKKSNVKVAAKAEKANSESGLKTESKAEAEAEAEAEEEAAGGEEELDKNDPDFKLKEYLKKLGGDFIKRDFIPMPDVRIPPFDRTKCLEGQDTFQCMSEFLALRYNRYKCNKRMLNA